MIGSLSAVRSNVHEAWFEPDVITLLRSELSPMNLESHHAAQTLRQELSRLLDLHLDLRQEIRNILGQEIWEFLGQELGRERRRYLLWRGVGTFYFYLR